MKDKYKTASLASAALTGLLTTCPVVAGGQSTEQVKQVAQFKLVEIRADRLQSRDPVSFGYLIGNVSSGSVFGSSSGGPSSPGKQQTAPAQSSENKKTTGCEEPASKKPVILATGEKFKIEDEFAAQGLNGLSLQRTYRSKPNSNAPAGMFGANWYSSYSNTQVLPSGCTHVSGWSGCIPSRINVWRPDGSSQFYNLVAGTSDPFVYKANGSAAAGTLTYEPGYEYILTRENYTYLYSADGYLQTVTGLDSDLTFTYAPSAPSQVTRVTNAQGQAILFNWSGGRVTSITDPSGNQWQYSYNANGMLDTVTSPGPQPDRRKYHYESGVSSALLTGISINDARYSTYAYQSDQRVSESGLAGAEERDTFSYATGSTTRTDASGQPTTYTFGNNAYGAFRLTGTSRASTSTCGSSASSIVYDSNGYIDYTMDWNGVKTDYTYDSAGRLIRLVGAADTAVQSIKENTWTGDNLTYSVLKGSAGSAYATITYTYKSSGAVASTTLGDFRTGETRQTSFDYATYSNGTKSSTTLTVPLPDGSAVSVLNFDESGNQTSSVNALGQRTTWSNFNGLGYPGRMTDPNGVVTDYIWDVKGNLQSATQHLSAGNRVTTYAYNNAHQVTDITYADGRVDRMRYGPSLRQIGAGNALNEFVQFNIDVAGNVSTTLADRRTPSLSGQTPVANAAGQFSSATQLDSLGRPYTQSGNNGQQVSYRYDNNGNLLSRTDVAGRVTSYVYDAANRVVQVTAADNGVTAYAYNPEGYLQQVTDPRGIPTQYTYNGLGQVLTQVSRDSGTTTYTYDSAGRMATKALANGVTIGYVWDKLGRMTSRTSGSTTESFTYDEGANGIGRLTRINDATGQTTFAYNSAGELIQQVATIYGNVYTTSWNYDVAGRLIGMTYPTGLSLAYGYDSVGRVASVTSNLGGASATIATNFLYQPATDRRYAWSFGNGLPRMVTLDADGRVTQLASAGAHSLSYGYSTVDNVASISDGVYPAMNASFSYDAVDRLTSVDRSSDPQAFSVDTVGNRTGQTRQGTGFTYNLDAQSNRLANWSGGGQSRSFGYDAVGNVSTESRSDGSRAYNYDPFNRLTQVYINNSFVGDYRSNAFNQRAYRGAGGSGTGYGYGPSGELLYEIGPQTTSYVWIGGELLGFVRAGQF